MHTINRINNVPHTVYHQEYGMPRRFVAVCPDHSTALDLASALSSRYCSSFVVGITTHDEMYKLMSTMTLPDTTSKIPHHW